MAAITISKKLVRGDDIVIIPRKEFDALVNRASATVREQDIVRWAREARRLARAGKLLPLSSLRKA